MTGSTDGDDRLDLADALICRSGHGDGTDLPVVPAPAELLDMVAFSVHAEDPFGPGSERGRP